MNDKPAERRRTGVVHINLPRLGEWTEDAACAYTDPEVFYPERTGDYRPALRICETCPVVTDCLKDALATERTRDRYGVRGGLTPDQRTTLAKRARRAERATGDAA